MLVKFLEVTAGVDDFPLSDSPLTNYGTIQLGSSLKIIGLHNLADFLLCVLFALISNAWMRRGAIRIGRRLRIAEGGSWGGGGGGGGGRLRKS